MFPKSASLKVLVVLCIACLLGSALIATLVVQSATAAPSPAPSPAPSLATNAAVVSAPDTAPALQATGNVTDGSQVEGVMAQQIAGAYVNWTEGDAQAVAAYLKQVVPAVVNDPRLATVTLTKTVGTEAGTCGTSTNISVAPNTDVYFCLTIQNTGDVTFTNHVISDPAVGINNQAVPLELGVGQILVVTSNLVPQLGPISAASTITNTATISSSNGVTATASASGTAIATVSGPTDIDEAEQPTQPSETIWLYLPAITQ